VRWLLFVGVPCEGGIEVCAELVEEERVERLEDVLLRRVVLAELSTGSGVADRLEHGAEDGGTDGRPVDCSGVEHGVAQVLLKIRQLDALVEDAAVDVWERR